MNLDKELKKEAFKTYGGSETNTGSAEAQIALFTEKIAHLTEYLKSNKKDYNTQRSLVLMVGKRRKLLRYVRNKDIVAYRELIAKVGIRDTFK
ncbi:MAG: 30S ribosomal protein S15 [Flavobacteriales bacterium]